MSLFDNNAELEREWKLFFCTHSLDWMPGMEASERKRLLPSNVKKCKGQMTSSNKMTSYSSPMGLNCFVQSIWNLVIIMTGHGCFYKIDLNNFFKKSFPS